MFIKCNFIYVNNFSPENLFCDRARYHFILTHLHLHSLLPPTLSLSFVCQRLRAFRYSINNNSVNLFFPPQRLCVYFFRVVQNRFISLHSGVMVVAAATMMMVYVWPINNTRINIEWRLKLDWTQRRVTETETHTGTKKASIYTQTKTMAITQEVILSVIRSIDRLNQIAICWVKITVWICNYYYRHMPPPFSCHSFILSFFHLFIHFRASVIIFLSLL